MSIHKSPHSSPTRPLAAAVTAGVGGGRFSPNAAFFAGAAGFSYDLSAASGLYTDSARTTPVTTAGDVLGSVSDLSGNGNHASQTTAGSKPTWQTTYADFDGVDDGWLTAAIDFTAVDVVTVVVGLRKGSDAAIGHVVELGTGGENGTFRMTAPGNVAANTVAFLSRGTTNGLATLSGVVAPLSLVASGQGDISADLSRVRVNGGAWTTSAADQGPGNLKSGPCYIGRRGAGTNPLSGRIYRMIVIGRLLTDAELIAAEAWCNAPFM